MEPNDPTPRFLAIKRVGDLNLHVVLGIKAAEEMGGPEEWSAFKPRFAPELEEGAELLIGTAPARVLWIDGDAAAGAAEGRVWIISQIRPSEVEGSAMPFLQGAGMQEQVVRRAL